MTTLTGTGFALTARCAGCGRDVPDWEERTREAADEVARVKSPDGGGLLLECETACEHCSNPRIRLSFRIG